MNGSTTQPKIFISYSWSSPYQEKWIIDLAERLMSDGVLVILDKWHLKEGQDVHLFMEKMVNDTNITKVLVICDSTYQKKANERKGGVGKESQLISKEVYENADQEKFVPIVKEYDSSGKPCIPHFMASRIYIDLSLETTFEENYQKLVRNLYNRPMLKIPPLGTPPSYITEEDPIKVRTIHSLSAIKDALMNDKKSTSGLIDDFLEKFINSLEDFRIDYTQRKNGEEIDDLVLKSIERLLPLRDNFIDFTNIVFKYSNNLNLVDKIQKFFERLISFQFKPESVQSWVEESYDNYKFFTYELFLYFISILILLEKYSEVSFFLNSTYFYRKDNINNLHPIGAVIFNRYVKSLDEIHKNRLKLNRISITADLIKQRANNSTIPFTKIVETDLIIHYTTALKNLESTSWWFPRCSVYNSTWGNQIDFFAKMISKRYFEKTKVILSVTQINDLKKLVERLLEINKNMGYRYYNNNFDHHIPNPSEIFDFTKIATLD